MCATVVWAVDAAGYTAAFEAVTERRLGVAPQRSPLTIRSARVPRNAVTFTLTRRVCDCDCVVGAGAADEVPGEVPAAAWLTWVHDLPATVPAVRRLAVVRAWSPALDEPIAPGRARGVRLADVDEPLLRGLGEDALLTVDLAPSGTDGGPARRHGRRR